MNIFLADDSETFRERLGDMLYEISGTKIIGESGDGFEAIDAIRKLCPEVVILDTSLPGMNGIEILEELKKNGAKPLVIMLTSYPYPQYKIKCMKLGVDFFFYKLTEIEKVAEVLQAWSRCNNK